MTEVIQATPRHISIDLETLGISATALILSIGAVAFDPVTGLQTDEGFYRIIDIENPVGGGDIDASTVCYWMNASAEARNELFGEATKDQRVDLRLALSELSEYLGFDGELPEGEFPDVVLWQRGDKDAQWLDSAYKGMQLAKPFGWWQVSDQRTFCKYFKAFLPDRPAELVVHNAYDDALYQALCVSAVFKRLAAVGHVCEPVITTVVSEQTTVEQRAMDMAQRVMEGETIQEVAPDWNPLELPGEPVNDLQWAKIRKENPHANREDWKQMRIIGSKPE